MKNKIIMVASLLLVTTLVYWQVNGHDFINFDDPEYIFANSHVLNGLSGESIRWAFSSNTINWHPLTWISHMADVQFFGLSPKVSHLVNLFFHVFNTALLIRVMFLLTGEFWKSLFVASLFALHPMHVESVAWAAERKDLLSTFFWFLTVYAYVKYVRKLAIEWYVLTCVLFGCGLMSKPMLVSLPLVLLLFDYWPLNRIANLPYLSGKVLYGSVSLLRLILEKLPLLLLAFASSIITISAQQKGGAIASLETFPISMRLANAIVAYQKYLLKMVWPADLSIIYPLEKQIDNVELVIALSVLILVFSLVIIFGKRIPYLPVGWLLFFISMIPVIGLLQVGNQAMADRYTYIPYTGLFMIIAWGGADVAACLRRREFILRLIAGCVLIVLSVVTWKRVGYWENSIKLFGQAVSVTGDYYVVRNLLGTALAEKMRIPEAIHHLETAIQDKPDFAQAHYNLGNLLEKTGNRLKAIESFSKAILFKPDFMDAYFNRAILNSRIGEYDKAKSDILKVLGSDFQQSLTNHNTPEEAYFLLGKIHQDTGDQEKAILYFSQASVCNPNYFLAYYNRGVAYKTIGRMAEAMADFTKACQGGNQQGCAQMTDLNSSNNQQ